MNNYRLYICDMDEHFVTGVRATVADNPGIELVGNSADGKRALQDIIRLRPDVVLCDVPLPGLDGIALLRETRRLQNPPSVIVCTRFFSEACMQCASKFGASFFLCKPVELQALHSLISECGRCARDANTRATNRPDKGGDERNERANIARMLLKELGLSPRLHGSAYILEAAIHYCGDEMLLRNLSRGLYTQLAERMGTKPDRIERSLRSAISIAYERGTLSRHFPSKPTNREFISFFMQAVARAGKRED